MESKFSVPPVQKREIFGWAMYDFANSSYTTVVITVIYSAFFVEQIVPASSTAKDSYWSIAIILATIVSLIFSPFVGVLCDFSGHKKKYLMASTLLCSLGTAALFWVEPGSVTLGIFLLVISNVGFMLGENFCASFLPDLASKEKMALISGIGWGIGYMGGLASLLLVLAVVPEKGTAGFIKSNQWAMVAIGCFFFIAALPTFLLVKERSRPAPGFESFNWNKLIGAGFSSLQSSLSIVRQYPVLFQFLLAFMVYMAGLEVVIKFVGIYATAELQFGTGELTIMFLIIQFSAMAGALGFGFVESKIGPKTTVLLTLILWVICIVGIIVVDQIAAFMGSDPKNVFFAISLLAGAGIGSTQSSSRAVVGMLTPARHSGQMFGFWGLFAKLSIVLGMTFGFISDALDSRRMALVLVIGFFVVGGILLLRIPLTQGIEAAKKES
ncbi:MAG: MFS transporter [SAR324 cluster bacterium]|nr:MFS transporter [SAR324 cluster bacterium]